MTEGRLKGYQVGAHDLVAHYSPEEARQLLKDGGYDEDDILLSDVHGYSEAFLSSSARDRAGN